MYAIKTNFSGWRVINDGTDLAADEYSATDLAEKELAAVDKRRWLKDECRRVIEGGFVSSALGAPHVYDSALPQDQINLTGARLANIDVDFTCTDQSGVKIQRAHTAAQIAQVYAAGMAHIVDTKAHYYARVAALDAGLATMTAADVAAFGW